MVSNMGQQAENMSYEDAKVIHNLNPAGLSITLLVAQAESRVIQSPSHAISFQ